MKNNNKSFTEVIYYNIRTMNIDSLSDDLNIRYNSKSISMKDKSTICFGYQVLSKHLMDPAKVIQALDRARQMFPGDKELLEDELDFLLKFIDSHKDELCDKDFELFESIILILQIQVQKSLKKPTNNIWNIFKEKIANYKAKSSHKGRSKIYQIAEPMMYNLFSDLSDLQREELRQELINETLHEMMMKEFLKKKESEKEYKKSNPSKQ